ncbi:MAG: ABC transporter substrate-binding protein [Dehalococcoidia bacterium]|nr:ABC transporter substrate-binding protein [Dehalococcoidia bacterium]MDW8008028.1 ABC transporter substrate-binding protein [Chloroflexota bacterium]
MRLKRAWLLLAALLSLGLFLAACEEEEGPASPTPGTTPGRPGQVRTDFGVTDTEIKLGHTNVLSGSLAAVYQPVTPALQAYFEYVNREKGGVCGRRITLIVEDNQYSPTVARERVTKLIEQDRVLALVGDLGTPAVTGEVDYVNEQKVPHLYVSTGASKWGDYQRWPWTTGYIPDYVSEGRILGRFAQERFPNAKVGILYQNDDFGLDGRNGFKQEFRGQIVAEQSYESTATDISSQLANIRAAGADLVYLYATPAFSARAFQYMQQNNWRPQVMMSYVNPPVLTAQLAGGGNREAGLQLVQGTISTNYLLDFIADADKPEMKEHVRIMQTYGGPPIQSLSVYGQSLAELVVETLKRACDAGDMTRQGVMRAAESIRGFRTSLLLPGITINLGPRDHFSIQALMPVQIQPDGTPRPLRDQPISFE